MKIHELCHKHIH